MQRAVFRLFTAFAASAFITACDDPAQPDPGPGEQELITQVVLTLTPSGGGTAISADVTDPDGLGPNPPNPPSQVLALTVGTTYDGMVEFFDASNPVDIEDITEEVAEEAEEHRVFYTVSGLNGVTIDNLDLDANNAPLGLTFTLTASGGASGIGTIRVVLSHYDETPKGDGSTPSTETDADVIFSVSF